MAQRNFLGHAADIPQADVWEIGGTWLAGDKIQATIDNITVELTVGSGSLTNSLIAAALAEAINGGVFTDATNKVSPPNPQSLGQFARIVAEASGANVTFTSRTAGEPFTLTLTRTSAGGTVTLGSQTPATGKNHLNNPDNLSGNAVLANGDVFLIDSTTVDLLYNLATGVQLSKLTKMKSATTNVGLPEINKSDTTKPFANYLPKRLSFNNNSLTTTYELEVGEGPGSQRQRYDAGAGKSTWVIHGSGQPDPLNPGLPLILLVGTHAQNELHNRNGNAAVGYYPDEATTVAVVRHGNGEQSQARTVIGQAATATSATININGGEFVSYASLATTSGSVTLEGGTARQLSGNVGTLTINGGAWYQECGGTVGPLVINEGAFDKSRNSEVLNISGGAIQLNDGGRLHDPNGTLAIGSEIRVADFSKVEIDLGKNVTIRIVARG
jgi:hypothetical protein